MRRTKCRSLIRSTLVPSPEPHLQALQYPVAATSSFRSSAADCDGPVEASCYEVRSPTCVAHLLGIVPGKFVYSEELKQFSVGYFVVYLTLWFNAGSYAKGVECRTGLRKAL